MSNDYTFSPEQFVQANNIDICYQTIGDPQAPPLLLVMGLGVQMLGWPDDFCAELANSGYFVVRFDNRDVGRSTHFDQVPRPRRRQLAGNLLFGRNFPTGYTLEDMADDAVALLDKLGIAQAHLIGASMGGMISQIVALNYPDRVRSLTSIMSTTSERDLPNATAKATAMLARPRSANFDTYLKNTISAFAYMNGTTYAFEEDRMRDYIKRAWQRSSSSQGVLRQMAAISNTQGRRQRLRSLTVPTLIIHGDADPLVPYRHGIDTAEAIPTARLVTVRGMGHTLPREAWPTIIGAILEHVNAVQQERPAIS